LKVIERSICGRFRETNEDVTGHFNNRTDQTLLLIADGMGGHEHGEVASQFVHDKIKAAWEVKNLFNIDEAERFLKDLVEKTNRALYDFQEEEPKYKGMGTTLVLVAVIDSLLLVLSVGDSRAYVMNNRKIEQVTEDHTFVNVLVQSGEITPEEALNHPRRNLITRAMGTEAMIQADVFRLRARQYDYVVLSTDGLTDTVRKEEIHQQMYTTSSSLEQKADSLVKLAEDKESKDNISLVILDLKRGDTN
jgi:protein phosphatase